MTKKRLNLSVNEDLVKKAREYDINLSSFLEIRLREFIALIEGKGTSHENNVSPESLINNNPLREIRARSLARTGRQPPKL